MMKVGESASISGPFQIMMMPISQMNHPAPEEFTRSWWSGEKIISPATAGSKSLSPAFHYDTPFFFNSKISYHPLTVGNKGVS